MGDAGFPSKNYILDEYNLPKMDIIKVGHHGSKYSSLECFIRYLSPDISLISVGENSWYGYTSDEVINNLNMVGSETYKTSAHGMIYLILKDKIIVNTCT